jgi:murein DD-endopeptidase MepM/ murein hydrolase activator NlpD
MPRWIDTALVLMLVAAGAAEAGGRFPWRRRVGRNVDSLHITAHKNTPIALWPEEPKSPSPVDPGRFEEALGRLCQDLSPDRKVRYARLILDEAGRFGLDPFLLTALVYDQSRCWPHTPKREVQLGRYGLTRIPHEMHAPHVREGKYTYYIRENGAFKARTVNVDRFPFNVWTARKPASNLYFAAAILSVLEAQAGDLDASFHPFPHRHFVSHWFYGDRVAGVEPENRVLTARRRAISYYHREAPSRVGTVQENPIVSPLDGVPRLVLDYFGNRRGKKSGPGHRGVDIDAAKGEPVRAVAAGRITFAGVDILGRANHRQLTPEEAAELPPDAMGPGGLYVAINHKNNFGTIYMHLDTIAVRYQDQVTAGQIIGTAGQSGAKRSGPHLHLEFRLGTDRTDPAEPLANVLINPYKNRKKARR